VNLGTENKNKTMAALVLVGLALIMVIYRFISPTGGSPTAAAVAPRTTQDPLDPGLTPTPTPARPAARKLVQVKKPRVASLDPTLRLGLLQLAENTNYTGNGRNIFRAQAEEIPKPKFPPVKPAPVVPTPPPGPPPPPPINLRFFGFASKPGEPKKVFLSQGEDVFIAGEGDIVDRRYKILRIGPASVEVEDVLNNNRQSIPLTQG